jgi:hypothetical protein
MWVLAEKSAREDFEGNSKILYGSITIRISFFYSLIDNTHKRL